jgi:hypothetical protein
LSLSGRLDCSFRRLRSVINASLAVRHSIMTLGFEHASFFLTRFAAANWLGERIPMSGLPRDLERAPSAPRPLVVARLLSSRDYYHRTRTHLSLGKDCPTHARSCYTAPVRWSPSITATNVSPPDFVPAPRHQRAQTSVRPIGCLRSRSLDLVRGTTGFAISACCPPQ